MYHYITEAKSLLSQYILCIFYYNLIFYYFLGDEILAVNGLALQGMSHAEAISVFKNIRSGKVLLHVARRDATIRR